MRTRLMIATLIVGLLGGLALAAELDGKGIVEKMADQTMSQSGLTDAKMIIIDKNGNQRVREMRMRTKEVKGLRYVVTTFLAPPDVRGTKFLVIEKKTGDDDQRIYLPALKRARKITSSNKSGSFMGSTFSYADLQSHDADQGTHTRLLPDVEVDGHLTYVVESVPNDADDEIYSKLVYWVRQDNFLPIKGEFYDKKDKLWKRLEVSEVEQRSDGVWIAKKTKMTDVQKGTATILELGDYEVGAKIDDAYFTERFLTDETME